jgi:hypothetical protein
MKTTNLKKISSYPLACELSQNKLIILQNPIPSPILLLSLPSPLLLGACLITRIIPPILGRVPLEIADQLLLRKVELLSLILKRFKLMDAQLSW